MDLTYTSNAIEGNALTLRETAEVIEHGITVGGESLRDHLEAVDHYNAVLWMRELASQSVPVDENFGEWLRTAGSAPDVYLGALELASLTGDMQPFQRLLYERLDAILSEYLGFLD